MIIYALTSPTGRIYIGQTVVDLPTRWSQHVYCAKSGHRSKLYTSMQKYAPELWTREVVARCSGQEQLDATEVMFIKAFGDLNLKSGGRAGKHSPETRAKISAAHMGKKQGPPSAETRAKQSATMMGRKNSPAHCAAISAGKKAANRTRLEQN